MDRAIQETERRRSIQQAYNREHGIVPRTIIKDVREVIEISATPGVGAAMNQKKLNRAQREAAIKKLTLQMREAAKMLEFEIAAELRDRIRELENQED